jgi:nucleoside-diphosphate-sugar epimerase
LLPGGPDRFISSISHDDAASAVVAALEASQGIYNVADDQPVRRARYFELLASNLERIPLTFEHSPRGERSFCILVG